MYIKELRVILMVRPISTCSVYFLIKKSLIRKATILQMSPVKITRGDETDSDSGGESGGEQGCKPFTFS